jgi:23S rRNA (guanine745-N1)-methyltransferase
MTPYYWKTPIEGSRRLAEAQSLYTELGFDLLVYRRI